jgi:hypothetical protein
VDTISDDKINKTLPKENIIPKTITEDDTEIKQEAQEELFIKYDNKENKNDNKILHIDFA